MEMIKDYWYQEMGQFTHKPNDDMTESEICDTNSLELVG
jgi:hypothetical protein